MHNSPAEKRNSESCNHQSRVGAIATIIGTDEKLQQAPGESDEAFEARVRAAPPKLSA
jgi:hypothetical protein